MSRRPIAWVIFLGFLALVGVSGALGIGNRAFQYLTWGFWLVFTAGFVWLYARTPAAADRQHLIDARGISLLPQPLRQWLFDE
jgi:hypothetical protein